MQCRSLKGAGARIFRGHNPSTTTPRPWIKVRETATVYPVPAMESVAGRNIMDQRIAFSFTFVPMLLAAIALVASPALGQQGEQTHHRYFVSAELTIEGMKNLQKQSATGLRAGVAEFAEAAECKLESWYFEPGASTARAIVDCSSEIGAAALQVSANAAGFAHVTAKSVLTARSLTRS